MNAVSTRSMDPRIRERRIAVQRDLGRRRLRVLGSFFGVLAVTGLSLLVLHSPWLSVSTIRVDGAAATDRAAAARAAAGFLHRPLVSLDAAAVVRAEERLAWVAAATARRRWPATLVVSVTPRTPVAQLQDAARRWATVDAAGHVLAVHPAPAAGLVDLGGMPAAGPAGSRLPPAAGGALSVAARLPAPLRASVQTVAPDSGGVALTLAGGVVVDLGPPSELPAKLQALSTVLSSVDMAGVRTIDLRLPDQPVLTRQ